MLIGTAVLLILGTFALIGAVVLVVPNLLERMFLGAFGASLLVYSGLGAAHPDVPGYYLLYYFAFLLAFSITFVLTRSASGKLGRISGQSFSVILQGVGGGRVWGGIIAVYAGLHVVPLFFPEFRLDAVFNPPPPESFTVTRVDRPVVHPVVQLADYGRLLLSPFFYIALYKFRHSLVRVILILGSLSYLQYVDVAYMGRGDILLPVVMVGIAAWVYHPHLRTRIAFLTVLFVPVALTGSYVYAVIRIGGTISEVNPATAIMAVLESETGFPRRVGIPVIESGRSVDFASYLQWIATLPVPKFLSGPISGARINAEISEIVLGVSPGHRRFYGVMPGIVAESVYIYGRSWFWLHGMFIGAVSAMVFQMFKRSPEMLFVHAFLILLLSYDLNRGGVSAVLPTIVNQFIILYGLLFVVMMVGARRSYSNPSLLPRDAFGHVTSTGIFGRPK